MQPSQAARPRAKSAFAAAFLSLIFPGLGHAYAGAYQRALAFAAIPILAVALVAGVFLRMGLLEVAALLLNPAVLTSVFVLNLLALGYRLLAVIDAYRVTAYMNAVAVSGDGRLGRARLPADPISLAGLLAIVLVMTGSHVVVARYDLLATDLTTSGCIFIGDGPSNTDDRTCDIQTSPSPGASDDQSSDDPSAAESLTPVPTAVGSALPNVAIPPWNGKDRLNILLLGIDQRPTEDTFNTDTMIVVSIDPVSKLVAMFSLPRDTGDVPLPPGPAQRVFGSTYAGKINGFFTQVRNRADLFPGTSRTRGYNALKSVLGNLYGLDIKYFVEVNFDGFKKVVDTLGGVTINVQVPVVDDTYPANPPRYTRIYIPSGIQHMNGDQALRYARSRHGSNDFDRAARQQRVLLSLREQADPQALIPKIPDLVQALKASVRTDIPVDQLGPLLGLASSVDTKDIRSYVFAPPVYGVDTGLAGGYKLVPDVGRIRNAVSNAFTVNPADERQLEKLAAEGANVWVLNATGDPGRGSDLAGYLLYKGVAASAPRQRPPGPVPADTKITVYNGAEDQFPDTIAFLEKTFKVKATTKNDPAIRTDIVVEVGRGTPILVAPGSV